MDGFIVVDKPAGVTSHDVVAAVRRALRITKVGHTGTLDPFATGVLPVAVGEATKAIQFLDESIKEYAAVMRLGLVTDSLDVTGTVLAENATDHLREEHVVEVCGNFIGKIEQIPPMYSAVKQGGVPLYKLARRGEEVERAARPVEIYSITIDKIDLPDVSFTVRCSRGTYVRTLAADIGTSLGCGACLTALRRNASGLFTLEKTVTLAAVSEIDVVAASLISCEAALGYLPRIDLTDQGLLHASHGKVLRGSDFVDGAPAAKFDEDATLMFDNRLVAVGKVIAEEGMSAVKIVRGFNTANKLYRTCSL